MLFSDIRQVVGEFARGLVRIDDEGVSLGGVDRVVDGVGCSLTQTSLVPTSWNLIQFRRGSLIVDNLSVLAGNVEWVGNEIWNVFTHKHVRIKMASIDFRGQI